MSRPTKRAIENKIRTALSGITKTPRDELRLDKDWVYYNMDMLAIVELIMTVEDDFELDELVVPDEKIKTPMQLAEVVYKTTKQKRSTHVEEV